MKVGDIVQCVENESYGYGHNHPQGWPVVQNKFYRILDWSYGEEDIAGRYEILIIGETGEETWFPAEMFRLVVEAEYRERLLEHLIPEEFADYTDSDLNLIVYLVKEEQGRRATPEGNPPVERHIEV